jgi:hypothetical protein
MLAVVLLALAGVLILWGRGEPVAVLEVSFPRDLREAEVARMETRRTQRVPATELEPGEARPAVQRDPVLAALPRGKGHSALVFEANALRHSPVGELLLGCVLSNGNLTLNEIRERTGLDLLQDLDRLVVTDEGVLLTGNFGNARLAEIFKKSIPSGYGNGAQLFEPVPEPPPAPDARPRMFLPIKDTGASWNDQMLVFSYSPESARGFIDRVEGRAGVGELPLLPEGSTYGEMYGRVSVEMLGLIFRNEQPELMAMLMEAADSVELHLDARSDVSMVVEVQGADTRKVEELGRSLEAALSVARLKAQVAGEHEVARWLDFASVRPDGARLQVELALPLEFLKDKLSSCAEERRAEERRAEETRQAAER